MPDVQKVNIPSTNKKKFLLRLKMISIFSWEILCVFHLLTIILDTSLHIINKWLMIQVFIYATIYFVNMFLTGI